MSSNTDVAIAARGVSKSYTITRNAETHTTASEALVARLKNPRQRVEKETFWALSDLSFEIARGDVVGVVGRNGAGKSTLLKILSQITEPTRGEFDLRGRVGSLLEVGTGFHHELTGRENIYLNGSILGMSRREITKQFEAIVEFAGVTQFLDTPVKRYSSGMYVRLAFAVAAHLSSEILIVDEVLAVGDAEFQRKCLGKMQDAAQSGRTVLFVSHHMQSVAALCNKGMYLTKGRMTFYGDVQEAVRHYLNSFDAASDASESDAARRPGSGELRLVSATPDSAYYECAQEKRIRFRIERRKPYKGNYFISAHIINEQGIGLITCDSRLLGRWLEASEVYEGEFVLRAPWLKPGRYRLEIFLCGANIIDRWEEACFFDVIPILPYPDPSHPHAITDGLVFGDYEWRDAPPVSHSLQSRETVSPLEIVTG